tara:strand:+ start:6235 stop:7074 length:840 start_codon:yes stop_codon:yes gene_type:complete
MEIQLILLAVIIVLFTIVYFIFKKKTTEPFDVDDHEYLDDIEDSKKVSENEDEEDEEDEESEEEKKIESESESEKKEKGEIIVSSSSNTSSKPITIHDTIRRDSKVASTLNYSYIDENCKKITVSNPYPESSIEYKVQEPKIVVKEKSCDSCPRPKFKCKLRDDEYMRRKIEREERLLEKINNSEMFDDSDLKPNPSIDSPYGFVYFPNKYWAQWGYNRPPVCTPTGNKCKVLPTYTTGVPVDVLDYTQVGSMMPKFQYSEEYEMEPTVPNYPEKKTKN